MLLERGPNLNAARKSRDWRCVFGNPNKLLANSEHGMVDSNFVETVGDRSSIARREGPCHFRTGTRAIVFRASARACESRFGVAAQHLNRWNIAICWPPEA